MVTFLFCESNYKIVLNKMWENVRTVHTITEYYLKISNISIIHIIIIFLLINF